MYNILIIIGVWKRVVGVFPHTNFNWENLSFPLSQPLAKTLCMLLELSLKIPFWIVSYISYYFVVWEPISTLKNSGARNKATWWTSSSESEPGSTDNCPSSAESTIPLVPTRPASSASRPRRATSSTDAESEEEAERDPSPRVSSLESPPQLYFKDQ